MSIWIWQIYLPSSNDFSKFKILRQISKVNKFHVKLKLNLNCVKKSRIFPSCNIRKPTICNIWCQFHRIYRLIFDVNYPSIKVCQNIFHISVFRKINLSQFYRIRRIVQRSLWPPFACQSKIRSAFLKTIFKSIII